MQTKGNNSSLTQHKLQYNNGVAMRDNAAQQWWYSVILVVNKISYTILVNCQNGKLQRKLMLAAYAYDDKNGNKNGKPSTIVFPILSLLSLLP